MKEYRGAARIVGPFAEGPNYLLSDPTLTEIGEAHGRWHRWFFDG
jgi:hypothetical protein